MTDILSLDEIYLLPNDYINSALQANDLAISTNELQNKLDLTKLFYRAGRLTPSDRGYVEYQKFAELYLLSDLEIAKLIEVPMNRFQYIRSTIDQEQRKAMATTVRTKVVQRTRTPRVKPPTVTKTPTIRKPKLVVTSQQAPKPTAYRVTTPTIKMTRPSPRLTVEAGPAITRPAVPRAGKPKLVVSKTSDTKDLPPKEPIMMDLTRKKTIKGDDVMEADLLATNKELADVLNQIGVYYKLDRDTYRTKTFFKAAAALSEYPDSITSGKQVQKDVHGVGKSVSAVIDEYLTTGEVQRLNDLELKHRDKKAVMDLFTEVHGIGPVSALKYFNEGYRTYEDLEQAPLTHAQRIGFMPTNSERFFQKLA